jgi:hypothetical protein
MSGIDSSILFLVALGLVMIVPAGYLGRLNAKLRRRSADNIAAQDGASAQKPQVDYGAMARFYARSYRLIGAFFLAMAAWEFFTRR